MISRKILKFFTPCYIHLFSSLGNTVTKGYQTILLYYKSSIKVKNVQLCDRFSRRYLNFFSRLFSAAACQLSSALFARVRAHALSFLKRSKKSASHCSTALNSSQQHVGQDLIFSHLLKNLSSNRCDFSIFDFVNSKLRFSFKMPVENKAPGGEDRLKSFKNKGKDTEVSFFTISLRNSTLLPFLTISLIFRI